MPKQKAVFGLWADIRIGDLNRLLKPYGVRLILKSSKDWGDQVSVIARPWDPTQPTPEAMANALRGCIRALGESEDGVRTSAFAEAQRVLGTAP